MPLKQCPICGVDKWWTDSRRKACGKCTRLIREANSTPCCAEHRRRQIEMVEGIISSKCEACLARERLIIHHYNPPEVE